MTFKPTGSPSTCYFPPITRRPTHFPSYRPTQIPTTLPSVLTSAMPTSQTLIIQSASPPVFTPHQNDCCYFYLQLYFHLIPYIGLYCLR